MEGRLHSGLDSKKETLKPSHIWKKFVSDNKETVVKKLSGSFVDKIERGSRDGRKGLISSLMLPDYLRRVHSPTSANTKPDEDDQHEKCPISAGSIPGSVLEPSPPVDQTTNSNVICIDEVVQESVDSSEEDHPHWYPEECVIPFFHRPITVSSPEVHCEKSLSEESLETIFLEETEKPKLSTESNLTLPDGWKRRGVPRKKSGIPVPKNEPLLRKRFMKYKGLRTALAGKRRAPIERKIRINKIGVRKDKKESGERLIKARRESDKQQSSAQLQQNPVEQASDRLGKMAVDEIKVEHSKTSKTGQNDDSGEEKTRVDPYDTKNREKQDLKLIKTDSKSDRKVIVIYPSNTTSPSSEDITKEDVGKTESEVHRELKTDTSDKPSGIILVKEATAENQMNEAAITGGNGSRDDGKLGKYSPRRTEKRTKGKDKKRKDIGTRLSLLSVENLK